MIDTFIYVPFDANASKLKEHRTGWSVYEIATQRNLNHGTVALGNRHVAG